MFGNLNKPAFGTASPSTSFGFGTATPANANPFGQSQLFGKPATGGFGSPSTSTFGQPATNSLFPSTQAQPTNLFQNANTSFGSQPAAQTGFGSNLFGQQQPATGGLFNTSTTAFGQQNKPTGFGFGAQTTQPTLFGQQAQPQQTTSMFQPAAGSLFGGSTAFGGQQSTGTVVKFNPVTGTDTMMKGGVAQSINTKHHSITCMKEYENKSFEELRFEDYAANRKGPQQQSGFGTTTPFGTTVSSAPTLFGQPDASKSAFGQTTGFGQTTTTFGQNTGFGLGTQQQQTGGLFGKPATGFGATTSTPSLNFGFGSTQTANPFGATQAKPFGSSSGSIFGTNTATTQAPTFGTGLFGQTNTTQNTAGTLFGKPAQPTTGFGATPNTGFSFSTPASTQPSLFSQPSKPLFGQPTTNTGFGQTNNAFGATTSPFANSFAKTTTPAFGTTPNTGFGTTLGGGSLFGNTTNKPGGLFGNNTGSTGLFGASNNTVMGVSGFGVPQQQPQQSMFPPPEQNNVTSNLALLTTDPFGDAPHLAGLEPKLKSYNHLVSTTDPKELKSLLDASKKVDTTSGLKLKIVPIRTVKDTLFDGIATKSNMSITSPDYYKTNCRRLVLRNRPTPSDDTRSPVIEKGDILSYINSSVEPRTTDRVENKNEPVIPNAVRPNPLRLQFDNTINGNQNSQIISQTFTLNNSEINSVSITEDNGSSPVPEIEIEEEPVGELEVQTPKSYAHGIICTRPEYYTLPSLEDLVKYTDESGKCIVKGFTIGRKGYGNVYFPDEMDVAGLNIDELLHFRYREINVYPDEAKKPPVGEGLNRKAQVTLDNVFPRRPGTNVLIKDVLELLQMNFAEKLRKITVNKDAKFVDYRPETGSWVFKVDHFSRYGFDESDEETVQVNGKEVAKKKLEEAKKPELNLLGPKSVEELAKAEALKNVETGKEMQVATLGGNKDACVEEDHFQGEDDIIHQSMYVDDISEEDYCTIPTDIPMHLAYDPFQTSKNIQVMKSTLFADDDRFSDGGGSHISIIRQFLDIPEDIPRLPVLREEVLPKKKILLRPKVEQVYNFGACEIPSQIIQSRCYLDFGMFKGKSFKVGWSKGFNLLGLNNKIGEINGLLALNTIVCGSQKNFDPLKECLNDSLEIVLQESSYTLDVNRIPTFKIIKNHSYLKKQITLFSKLMAQRDTKESQYLHSIWTLAEALWGPTEETISNRRHLLSEWLKVNTNFNDLSTKQPEKEIFNLLSVFKILDAANLAMDKRYPNLALIISQLSLTNRTKIFLQEQIESWYKSMIANHISEDMKRVYLLLSGIPVKETLNIFHDVDWKRAFGMHLWYVSPASAPVEMAIELYKKAFEEQGYAEMPYPPYRSGYVEEGSFDVLYHMLLLYKTRIHRLSTVLNPTTHTDDSLDYRLSWLLLQLFLSLNVGIIEDSEKNKLCTSFSNQLETLGEWEWAIFVLLHLEDNNLKKNLVLGILDRNLSPDVDKATVAAENELVNRMHLPPEWIHTVKGTKTLLSQRYFEAFNHFAHAGDHCKANDILIEHLLPCLFINEQYDIIKILISAIADGADEIARWNNEAGLFSDFLELQERFISFRAEDILQLQASLQSISDRIASFPVKTDQQKLCVAEMSKRCASVYRELCEKPCSSLFKKSYSDFIESLVMPPDYKQNEALNLVNRPECFRC
ncbi:nuclear pore complex protein Nup98-96 [Leptinotarsa decemlineata]|uniref:nuclear pore complex protein Nup98-96 n=1 Tax=Leptinotarsa decemlineata TaxID=7539 RepID=UPI003D30C63E